MTEDLSIRVKDVGFSKRAWAGPEGYRQSRDSSVDGTEAFAPCARGESGNGIPKRDMGGGNERNEM